MYVKRINFKIDPAQIQRHKSPSNPSYKTCIFLIALKAR
jgi:hypothetical protein